jgi:hypothetical protein
MTSRAATWNNWISRETGMRTSAEVMVRGKCNGVGECGGWTMAEDIQVDGKKTGK